MTQRPNGPTIPSPTTLLRAGAVVAALTLAAGCAKDDPTKPLKVDPAIYKRMVSAFFTGTTALQVGDDQRANRELNRATEIVPDEPATWANLGVLALKSNNYPAAREALERAAEHSVPNSQITYLTGLRQAREGKNTEAVGTFRKAIKLDPANLVARYALIEELRRESGQDSEGAIREQFQAVLDARPQNLIALTELSQLAAKADDRPLFERCIGQLSQLAVAWPVRASGPLTELKSLAPSAPLRSLVGRVQLMRNLLTRTPQYRRSFDELKVADGAVAQPLDRFLRLPNPLPTAAPADDGLTFSIERGGNSPVSWARSMLLRTGLPPGGQSIAGLEPDPDGPPMLVTCNSREVILHSDPPVRLAFPGNARPVRPEAVAPIDWSRDYRPDLAMAGQGGLRLYEQGDGFKWTDVTARAGLPATIVNGRYLGVWPIDLDLDADLDLVLGTVAAMPTVLRNNGDGTWKPMEPLRGPAGGLDSFLWADFDDDGDPDVAALSPLTLFENERGGYYRSWPLPASRARTLAIAVADIDQHVRLDIIALLEDGSIHRISHEGEPKGWKSTEIARLTVTPRDSTARLLSGDLDNNGAADLVLSSSAGTQVWLGKTGGGLQSLPHALDFRAQSLADLNGDGRLDLTGVDAAGIAVRGINEGSKDYKWQVLRPRADKVVHEDPDGPRKKINSFGIGGDAELRAGLLVQRQPLVSPIVHFGLGEYAKADVVRFRWPNGFAQAEFPAKADEVYAALQRIGGSCPWLFAWNGSKMDFVTDILWRSGLGIRINSQETAGVVGTREWVKVRADQLAPRDGFYDLRITAELWETHFFDHVALMTVDHPAGTDVFVDERFSAPPPPLSVRVFGETAVVARAVDDRGMDVTERVRVRDGRYINTFQPTYCQGVARDHWVEIELPSAPLSSNPSSPPQGSGSVPPPLRGSAARNPQPAARGPQPTTLIAYGWLRPTDSSINVALGQGKHPRPTGLSLEVPDGKGGWRVARANQGFPAGKNKTLLFDLQGLFPPGGTGPRRMRLRTNMEIYWDMLAVAGPPPNGVFRSQTLAPTIADLRYRGFSVAAEVDSSSPEIPDYNRIAGTAPRWLDLIGYHTRFGDVLPLLKRVEDRYVIMNAGDELALRFPAPPPPPVGWVRDFVFISDGWEKDGNFNTGFSKTVLPLPSHDEPAYTRKPGRLEDEPVYRRYPKDWETYHTRYVTPDSLRNAMRVGQ